MARFFKKLAERFKPGIYERLEQASEAKKKLREEPAPVQAKVVSQQIDARPTGGVLVRSQVELHTLTNNQSQTAWEIRRRVAESRWQGMYLSTNNITSATTYNDPWNQWFIGGTGDNVTCVQCTNTATTDSIYEGWITSGDTITVRSNQIFGNWVDEAERTRPHRAETAAQKRRREEEEARYREERDAANARYHEEERAKENKRKAAEDRAMQLLMFMLTPEQQSDLRNHKHFFVSAPSGRLYRIDHGTHGNLKVVDRQTRKVIERLCVQPPGVPAGDAMLMQKLLIETGEAALRKHANITMEATGEVLRGDPSPLTGEKLAQIIPLRKAA